MHFRGKRPIPRLPKLAHAVPLGRKPAALRDLLRRNGGEPPDVRREVPERGRRGAVVAELVNIMKARHVVQRLVQLRHIRIPLRLDALVAPQFSPLVGVEPMLGLTQLSNYLTLKSSFSAVSKLNLANKYALE